MLHVSHTIAAPAKINLSLRIAQKRADGYHELESLVCFADLGDVLRFETANRDELSIGGEFAHGVPNGPDNLILKTLRLLRESAQNIPHFKIHLQKNIPVGAGLGGGSADAGAVIRLIREYFTESFAKDFNWTDFARRIGADVPVCAISKPCIMRGVGEQIELLPNFQALRGVLIFPRIPVATAPVFAAWNGKTMVGEINAAMKLENANDLFAPAAGLHPELQNIARLLAGSSNSGWGMSGSGSCFYALALNGAAQQKLLQDMQNLFPDYWVRPITIAAS